MIHFILNTLYTSRELDLFFIINETSLFLQKKCLMKMIFARYKLGLAKAASTYIYLGQGLMENIKGTPWKQQVHYDFYTSGP